MKVLIDTNILLDVIQDRKPHNTPAVCIWKYVEQRTLAGYVSAISFNNIFYIARKQAGFGKALEAVRIIRGIFQIVPLDESVIDRAIAVPGNDFEDAIQAAAALHIAADYVVTRNIRDFNSLGVSPITADELLAIMQ